MQGSIYRRGKFWWVAWYESVKTRDGKLRRVQRYASSKSSRRSDAVTLLNTKLYEARTQKPRSEEINPNAVTYEQVRDAWLEHYERVHPGRLHVFRRGPLKGQPTFAGRKYLDEYFHNVRAAHIDTDDLEKFQASLTARGMGNGADRAMASLRGMLRYVAIDKCWFAPSLLPHKFPMLRRERKSPEPIDAGFEQRLRDQLTEPFRTAFILAFHSGMRMSEIERLRWEHVNLARKRLDFPSAKTGKWRAVPLLADTANLLAALKPGKPNDLVFPGFDDRTMRARVWRHAAVASGCGNWYCRKCGSRLVNSNCGEHGLLSERGSRYDGPQFRHTRHTAIRNLTTAGVPIQRIMQMTGHTNVPMHMDYNVPAEQDLDLIRESYDAIQPAHKPKKVRLIKRKM